MEDKMPDCKAQLSKMISMNLSHWISCCSKYGKKDQLDCNGGLSKGTYLPALPSRWRFKRIGLDHGVPSIFDDTDKRTSILLGGLAIALWRWALRNHVTSVESTTLCSFVLDCDAAQWASGCSFLKMRSKMPNSDDSAFLQRPQGSSSLERAYKLAILPAHLLDFKLLRPPLILPCTSFL